MIQTIEQALNYLKSSEKVVMPSKFTYWCHSSQYKTGNAQSDRRGVWDKLPTDEIVVKHEMSFLSRYQRLQYVSRKQSFDAAPVEYTPDLIDKNLKGFQIKVMVPKRINGKRSGTSLSPLRQSRILPCQSIIPWLSSLIPRDRVCT